jgi:purine-cytosine permease-like protein
MPGLRDVYPTGVGWVLAVLAVGALISVVAALGYRSISKFANWAAPWMILVFLAFGIVGLLRFLEETGTEVRSAADLWKLAETTIWTGGEPQAGQTKFTFWHVTFFAWFCNAAMHLGMSDLSVLRFARRSWYGVASAAGMYIGHFMAWLSAALLYALQLHRDPSNDAVLPGPMAWDACGLAGILCVIVAGWTTANPTIYRAGLAFQAIVPRVSRVRVTLATGLLATVAGMFPAIAMKLLGFVALYGLVLVPMGAVVVVDFWVLPRFGLRPWWAQHSGSRFHPAAAIAWGATLLSCLALCLWGGVEIYFASLPAWLIAAVLYALGSFVVQRRAVRAE